LQVATCLPDATTEMFIDAPVQPADCRELTAVGHLASCAGAGDVLMARSRQLMWSQIALENREAVDLKIEMLAGCRRNLLSKKNYKKNYLRAMVGWEAMVRVLLPKGSGRSAAW
jgi:hypothetical protein